MRNSRNRYLKRRGIKGFMGIQMDKQQSINGWFIKDMKQKLKVDVIHGQKGGNFESGNLMTVVSKSLLIVGRE